MADDKKTYALSIWTDSDSNATLSFERSRSNTVLEGLFFGSCADKALRETVLTAAAAIIGTDDAPDERLAEFIQTARAFKDKQNPAARGGCSKAS